jgi:hypothetical protein
MSTLQDIHLRPVLPGMKWLLLIASILVFMVGVQLFVFAEQTARLFAWTIDVPLTAAFLGAAYWASFALEFAASRQTIWTRARIAVPAVLLFTTLTLIVTLLHLDRFHIGGNYELITQFATWTWVAVYAIVPVVMTILLILQLRVPGRDGPRRFPLPIWVRAAPIFHAAVMLPLGLALFIAPQAALLIWPWALTPLTARAVGAWLLGLGVAAAQSVWENDWERVAIATTIYVVLGVLELLAVLRYPQFMDWSRLNAWVYLIFVLSILVFGIYGWLRVRRLTQISLPAVETT